MEVNQLYIADFFEKVSEIKEHSVDLIICDGPYGVTNQKWDKIGDIQQFNLKIIRLFSRILKEGGSLYLFGKPHCLDFIDYRPYLKLNSRIVWYQPSRLAQGRKSYTNNYDIIAYFSKGIAKTFALDEIRIPQLVELKHRLRVEKVPSVVGGKFAKTKFNKKGKNPGDVWGDIKQLTYKSKELINKKLLNTIQKPVKLIERLVKASSKKGDLVLDPFAGVGTTFAVCKKLKRNFIGFEINPDYVKISQQRIAKMEFQSKEKIFLY